MDHDSVKLIFEFGSILDGILSYSIYTDEKITGKTVTLTIVESDDVGEIVMLKIFLIDIKKIVVWTENDIDLAYPSDLTLGYKPEPFII